MKHILALISLFAMLTAHAAEIECVLQSKTSDSDYEVIAQIPQSSEDIDLIGHELETEKFTVHIAHAKQDRSFAVFMIYDKTSKTGYQSQASYVADIAITRFIKYPHSAPANFKNPIYYAVSCGKSQP